MAFSLRAISPIFPIAIDMTRVVNPFFAKGSAVNLVYTNLFND
jgi:hypothetical protein